MDGHRHVDAVTDASLDREIASLIAVEPSPEFLARVRTRVAEEPSQSAWRWSWMVATAGAVAVAIVMVVMWPSRGPMPSSDVPVPEPRIAEAVQPAEPLGSSPPPLPQPERRLSTRARAVVIAAARDQVIEIDLPEVVTAENEVKTFASLMARIRQKRFDAAVPAAPNPDTPLEIKELPPVEPLEIEPIVKLAVLQAEGERP